MSSAARHAEPAGAVPRRWRGPPRITDPAFARQVVPLAGAMGAVGLVAAFMATTMSLFLADAVRAGPLLIGLFFAGRGVASVVVSLAAGRISDRLPDRRSVIVFAGVAAALGGLVFAALRDYVALLVVGGVCLAIGDVSYPQVYAYANEYAQARGRSVTAFTSAIRSVSSAAWVVGPPAAFFLLTRFGFGPLYLAAAGLSLGIALCGRALAPIPVRAPQAAAREQGVADADRRAWSALPARTWLLLGVVIGLSTAVQMYLIDIALYVTKDLRLGAQLVGWMSGLCAAVEIPIMIGVGRVADRLGKPRVVSAAAAGGAAFFCLLPLARSAPPLLALQLLNAAWTAVVLSIPVAMVQQEVPAGAGAATALYSSAFTLASLLAGAVTGVTATTLGFGNVFWVCAAVCVVCGCLLLARDRAARTPARSR